MPAKNPQAIKGITDHLSVYLYAFRVINVVYN